MAQDLLIATFRHRLPLQGCHRRGVSETVLYQIWHSGGWTRRYTQLYSAPPQCLPPYPPHSGTIPRIYRYTRPCSDSERNVKNMERIDIMVYQWKSKLFFFRGRWCEKINLDVRFSSGAGFIQKKNYIWNLIFLLIKEGRIITLV